VVFAELMDQGHHLHPLLRDQRTISGIGRSWVDEILWTACLSPFKKASDLEEDERERLRVACAERLGAALEHYEEVIGPTCRTSSRCRSRCTAATARSVPRCGTRIEAIHFKDYVMCYCPKEQTGGRVLKDRRLSRLLK
jgi:Formamidopyrimidine-DNA glycosylase